VEGFEKLFPIIILVIFAINMIAKWLGEQSKQAQKGDRERKRYPGLTEGENGRPMVVTRTPSPQVGRPDIQPPEVGGRLKRMEQEFEEWLREEAEEEGRVIWEAPEEDVEEFLAAERKPIPPPPPVQAPPVRLPGLPEIKPTVEPPRVEVTPPPSMAAPPTARGTRTRAPESEKRARLELPAGVFADMDDVRRGIIMSEILGPPVSMR